MKFKSGFLLKFVSCQDLDFHLKAYEMSRCPSFDTFLDPTNKKYTFIEILIIRLCIWVEHLNIFPICNSLSAKRFKSFCPGHNTSSIFKRQSHSEYYPNSQLILHAHQIQKNVSSYFKNQKTYLNTFTWRLENNMK